MGESMEGGATARRALRLLEALAATGPQQSLETLAEGTGLAKSTAYRLLRVLQDERYVERVDGSGYRLGPRLVGLAAAALPQMDLYATVRPILRRLARTSGETVTLHRRAGDLSILVLAEENEEYSLRRVAAIGEASTLCRGAAGLSILAGINTPERERLIARAAAPSDRPGIVDRLTDIRHRGVATSAGENHPGVNGISILISSTADSETSTSIAVSGPAERWSTDRMALFVPELRLAEQELSRLFQLEAGAAPLTGRASHV